MPLGGEYRTRIEKISNQVNDVATNLAKQLEDVVSEINLEWRNSFFEKFGGIYPRHVQNLYLPMNPQDLVYLYRDPDKYSVRYGDEYRYCPKFESESQEDSRVIRWRIDSEEFSIDEISNPDVQPNSVFVLTDQLDPDLLIEIYQEILPHLGGNCSSINLGVTYEFQKQPKAEVWWTNAEPKIWIKFDCV